VPSFGEAVPLDQLHVAFRICSLNIYSLKSHGLRQVLSPNLALCLCRQIARCGAYACALHTAAQRHQPSHQNHPAVPSSVPGHTSTLLLPGCEK
jgi:hypothetical protein